MMDKAELARHNRRVRDRRRENLNTSLRDQLYIKAELLCDSHSPRTKSDPQLIDEIFNLVLQMAKVYRLNDDKRQALAQHFHDSAYRNDVHNEVQFSDDMLYLNGRFSLRALAERMVWIGVAEQYRTVGEDGEED